MLPTVHRAMSLSSSATMLTDFLVIVLTHIVIGLILLDHVMMFNHDLRPELNQGPADLQSAALTTEL